MAVLLALIVPRGRDLIPGPGGSAPAGPRFIRYTVVAGDTPPSVASLFAVDPSELARENGMSGVDFVLVPGEQLRVDAARLWARISGGSPATNETLVEVAARRLGLEPALAVAVAWQESRLDQTAHSKTGAIGIMQIEPDTATLAARDLRVSIDARNPADNALAGVFWLHSLLSSYGGDRASALAAYYEGPGNLERRGYLPGTAEYVARALGVRRALLAATRGELR
jgi:soluble lytic murein transglycosylase-like protein